jgi:5-methyltetrahydrofolate--homocysteine methyltransferase
MSTLEELRAAVVAGQAGEAVATVNKGLEEGVPAGKLLAEGLVPAMKHVGELYEEGEIFVPEMLLAARAMSASVAAMKPELVDQGVEAAGRVAIGTAHGDQHDIGKNLVAMMLEGAGFEVVDLGVDVSPERFIDAVRAGANVVAMSALLTTTMTNMKKTIDAIEQAGLREQVRVVVGGAPITEAYAKEIGADGYAPDAFSAVGAVQGALQA